MTEDDIHAWLELGKQMVNKYNVQKVLDSEWVPKICTCGIESAGIGGKHSNWCEKEQTNDQIEIRRSSEDNSR